MEPKIDTFHNIPIGWPIISENVVYPENFRGWIINGNLKAIKNLFKLYKHHRIEDFSFLYNAIDCNGNTFMGLAREYCKDSILDFLIKNQPSLEIITSPIETLIIPLCNS